MYIQRICRKCIYIYLYMSLRLRSWQPKWGHCFRKSVSHVRIYAIHINADKYMHTWIYRCLHTYKHSCTHTQRECSYILRKYACKKWVHYRVTRAPLSVWLRLNQLCICINEGVCMHGDTCIYNYAYMYVAFEFWIEASVERQTDTW